MENILAPKLAKLTGVPGGSWHWVLSNHLSEEGTGAILMGGGTELSGLQFAEDQGATTLGAIDPRDPCGEGRESAGLSDQPDGIFSVMLRPLFW